MCAQQRFRSAFAFAQSDQSSLGTFRIAKDAKFLLYIPIFFQTRKMIGAIFQHITYNEFLPAILDEATMTRYNLKSSVQPIYNNVYNSEVNPSIHNAFAAAAFR